MWNVSIFKALKSNCWFVENGQWSIWIFIQLATPEWIMTAGVQSVDVTLRTDSPPCQQWVTVAERVKSGSTLKPVTSARISSVRRQNDLTDWWSETYQSKGITWVEPLAPGNLKTLPDSATREPPSFLWAETCLRDGSVNSADSGQTSTTAHNATWNVLRSSGVNSRPKLNCVIHLPFQLSSWCLLVTFAALLLVFSQHVPQDETFPICSDDD